MAQSLNPNNLSTDTATPPKSRIITARSRRLSSTNRTSLRNKPSGLGARLHILVLLISAVSLYLSEFRLPCTPIVVATDQWINVHGAMRMANGETIYADFFQYIWPGTEVVFAGLIKLFGGSVLLFCVVTILLGVAFAELGIQLSQRMQLGNAAVLPALLFLAFARVGFDSTHHKFSILLVLAATAILLGGQDLGRLAATGALIGVASFFTQTRAICLFAIAAFMLFRAYEAHLNWRRIAAQQGVVVISFALAVVVLLWRFVEPIGLRKFIDLTFSFPLHYYRAGDHNNWNFYLKIPPIGSGVFFDWLIMNALIPAIYLVFFVIWWQRREIDSSQPWNNLLLINLVGLALFCSIGYAPILSRLCEVSLPAIVIAVWAVQRYGYEKISSAGLWAAATAGIIALAIRTQTRACLMVPRPGGNVAVIIPNNSPKSMVASAWMTAHTKLGEVVFIADDPTLYTVLGLTNPTELPFVTPTPYTRPEQITKALAALTRRKPEYILWNDNLDPRADANGDALSPLRRLIREHFTLIKEFSNGEQVFARATPQR